MIRIHLEIKALLEAAVNGKEIFMIMDFGQSTQSKYTRRFVSIWKWNLWPLLRFRFPFPHFPLFYDLAFSWNCLRAFFYGLSTPIRNYMEQWLHPLMLPELYALKHLKRRNTKNDLFSYAAEISLIKSSRLKSLHQHHEGSQKSKHFQREATISAINITRPQNFSPKKNHHHFHPLEDNQHRGKAKQTEEKKSRN